MPDADIWQSGPGPDTTPALQNWYCARLCWVPNLCSLAVPRRPPSQRSAFQANAGCGHLAIRPGVPTRHRHFKIRIAGGLQGQESGTEGLKY
eukprot:1967327-Alexandrium_andersonii.AAC.1